ncbi:hypothetical protein [Streptomyces sp. NRRL S-920]|uniref:hypothetical protein n=1 Tax=Streptomyces sp. NRRL S-920 TaxID=1463921 RepID=UPI0004CA0A2A|nr:hypothetical protein [Streptomyces sp. NRRL S-920]
MPDVPDVPDVADVPDVPDVIGPRARTGLPIVALPNSNDAQAAHPAVARHVDFLRDAGVTVLLGEEGFTPHKPKQGDLNAHPCQAALGAQPAEGLVLAAVERHVDRRALAGEGR